MPDVTDMVARRFQPFWSDPALCIFPRMFLQVPDGDTKHYRGRLYLNIRLPQGGNSATNMLKFKLFFSQDVPM